MSEGARRRLTSFEVSDHNLHKVSLSYSEVKEPAVTPFSALAKVMPKQFVSMSAENLSRLPEKSVDGEEKVYKGPVKHSLMWWLSGMLHPDAQFRKLATRDDKDHLHKTLGILSVCSFIYRYGYVYNVKGNLGFEGTVLDWTTMFIHTALAFSAIIFRVPERRLDAKPMVIYEEYRQHAMVFTNRCLWVYMFAVLFPTAPLWAVPVCVCVHHYQADRVTDKWGSGSTAVRANTDKATADATAAAAASGSGSSSASANVPTFYQRIGMMYSFYQFLAVASHILPNARLADMAYNAIIAIQSSAFMMTLYRKKIVRGRTHVVVYSSCLLLSAYHILRVTDWYKIALVVCAFALRVNLPRGWSNKYLIWVAFLLAECWGPDMWYNWPAYQLALTAKLASIRIAGAVAA
jgi:hypothetical protein